MKSIQRKIERIFKIIVQRFRQEFRRNLKREYRSLNKEIVSRKLAKAVYNKAHKEQKTFKIFLMTEVACLVKQDSLTSSNVEEREEFISDRETEPNYSFFKEIFVDILSGNRTPDKLEVKLDTAGRLVVEATHLETKNTKIDKNDIGWIWFIYLYLWTCSNLNENDPEMLITKSSLLKLFLRSYITSNEMKFSHTIRLIVKIASRIAGMGKKPVQPVCKKNLVLKKVYQHSQKLDIHEKSSVKPMPIKLKPIETKTISRNENISDIEKFIEFAKNRKPFQSILCSDWPAFKKWTYQYLNITAGHLTVKAIDLIRPNKTHSKKFSFMIDDTNDSNWIMHIFSCPIHSTPLKKDVTNFPLELYVDQHQVSKYIFLQGKNKSSRIQYALDHTFIIQIFGVAEVRLFPEEMGNDLLFAPHINFSDPKFSVQHPDFNTKDVTLTKIQQYDVIYLPKNTLYGMTTVEASCMVIITIEFDL